MRNRSIVKKVYFTEEELQAVEQKMHLMGTENFGKYARKMLIDGLVIQVDYTDIKKQTYEINKIGNNINQLVKRMHETGNLYEEDINEVKEMLEKIWQQQRHGLLNVPSIKR